MQSCGAEPALLLLRFVPKSAGELKVTLVFHCSGFPAKDLLVTLALDGKGLPASHAMLQVTQAAAAFAPAGEGFLLPLVPGCPRGNPAPPCWWPHTCWEEAIALMQSLHIVFQRYLST